MSTLRACYDESELALTGGRWVRVGLTMRWEVESHLPEPAPRPRVPFADLIACPTCHATITQGCRSEGGRPREPHVNRLVARRCPCGASLAPRKRMCEPCRVEARLETHRRYDAGRDRSAA